MDAAGRKRIHELVTANPDATIPELTDAYNALAERAISTTTFGRQVRALKLTRKKKTLKAAEQDRQDVQEARKAFAFDVASIEPARLVFLDEFGCNTAMTRRFARALRGQRAFGSCPVNYGANVSVAGAIRLDGIVAALIVDGAFDGEAFTAFTTSVLVPCLRAGDVVVMDNLSSHKVTGIVEAIEAVRARVMYLPPYSPDFNPIEMCWSKVKAYLRAQAARTGKPLDDAIARGLELVTLSDLAGWFGYCGYAVPT